MVSAGALSHRLEARERAPLVRAALPLSRRKRIPSQLLKTTSTVLLRVFGIRRRRDLSTAVQRLDLEGIVAKRLADRYTPDTVWRKVRNGAYTPMEGRRDFFHPPSKGA
jgi:hypothetical protein